MTTVDAPQHPRSPALDQSERTVWVLPRTTGLDRWAVVELVLEQHHYAGGTILTVQLLADRVAVLASFSITSPSIRR